MKFIELDKFGRKKIVNFKIYNYLRLIKLIIKEVDIKIFNKGLRVKSNIYIMKVSFQIEQSDFIFSEQ